MKIKLSQIELMLIILFMMNSSSCRKVNKPTICTPENTVRIPEDAVNRFFFKDSSYWIYQDSASGLIDSVWVYGFNYGSGNLEKIDPSSKGKCFEAFTVKFNSKFRKYDMHVACVGSASGTLYENEGFRINYMEDGLSKDGFNMKGYKYLMWDIDDGDVHIIDSSSYNGTLYKNILVNSNKGVLGNYYFLESFYIPKIGLIRYRLTNNSVWNIIRYNIKQ